MQPIPEAGKSLPALPLQNIAADMRHKNMNKLTTVNSQELLPSFSWEISLDSMLEDAKQALTTIPTIITQTIEPVYTTVTVILEMRGYMIKKNCSTYPPTIGKWG